MTTCAGLEENDEIDAMLSQIGGSLQSTSQFDAPIPPPLGPITFRVEHQQRGPPHFHFYRWVVE